MSGQAVVGAGAYCPFPGTGISPPFMIRGSPFPCITIFSIVFGAVFDKNSLWGELNIQKGELCVKGILAQVLVSSENVSSLGFLFHNFRQGWSGPGL